MNYEPQTVTDSKVVPGARFTVKKLSVKRRAAFVLSIAEWTDKDRELRKEIDALREEYRAALRAAGVDLDAVKEGEDIKIPEGFSFPTEKLAQMARLMEKRKRLHGDLLTPAYIRCGFKSIEGFTIAGKAPDAEMLIEDGPPELCEEISAAVDRAMGMSLEERLNLASPSTSGARVDGTTQSTIAPSAEQ